MRSFLQTLTPARLCCTGLFAAALLLGATAFSQSTPPTAAPDTSGGYPATQRIRLFINCRGEDCFEDFFKTELSFFQTVRDLAQADVQVFLVQQETAGGGQRYTVRFIGQKDFAGVEDSAVVVAEAATTEASARAQLLTTISTGLAPYVMRTPWRSAMRVSFPVRTGDALLAVRDP